MKLNPGEKVQFQHPITNETCKGVICDMTDTNPNEYVVQIGKKINGVRIFLVKAKDLISTPF